MLNYQCNINTDVIPPSRPSLAVGSAHETICHVCSFTAVFIMFGGHVKLGGVLSPDFKQKLLKKKIIKNKFSLCFDTKQRIIISVCIYKL